MNKKRGFLLLESIIYLAILSLIIGMIYSLIFFNLNSFNLIQNEVELQQQSYTIKNHIKSNFKRSSNFWEYNSKKIPTSSKRVVPTKQTMRVANCKLIFFYYTFVL